MSLESALRAARVVACGLFSLLVVFGASHEAVAQSAVGNNAEEVNNKKVDSMRPFFMLATSRFADAAERSAILDSLQRHVTNRDYLGNALAQEFPELGDRLDRHHVFVLPTSLKAVKSASAKGCGPGTAGLIIYNGEKWPETPPEEQSNMPTAIAQGKAMALYRGCHNYGVAPGAEFVGFRPNTCDYNLDGSILSHVDWSGIELLDIQGQGLIGDRCNARAGLDAYVAFMTAIARELRAKGGHPKIVAQVSFRFTPPERMIAAIRRLQGIVDGFYIAYPSNVGPPCAYCSPRNLEEVLSAIRAR